MQVASEKRPTLAQQKQRSRRALLLVVALSVLSSLPDFGAAFTHWSDELAAKTYAGAAWTPYEYPPSTKAQLEEMLEKLVHRNYATPRDVIVNGVSYVGAAARFRTFLKKLAAGERLTISAVGGSITARCGGGCDSYLVQLFNWIQKHYPNDGHKYRSGAVPGTTSEYLSTCLGAHLEPDADLVIVELAVNDKWESDKHFTAGWRRGLERLLRKVMNFPKQPAVIMLNMYAYCAILPCGSFMINSERDFSEFALYYSLPSLSMKAGMYHRQDQAVLTGNNDSYWSLPMFYDDSRKHPGMWGHYVMGEMVLMLMTKVLRDMLEGDLSEDEEHRLATAPIPKPMLPNNYEPLKSSCFVGDMFKDMIAGQHGGTAPKGWDWIVERGKPGYISERAGDVIEMVLDTRVATSVHGNETALVQLCYLVSYEHMGKALVSCISGCNCEPSTFNGHSPKPQSVTLMHNMYISQAESCRLRVEVSPETSSGEFKVKLLGVVVSEEAGQEGKGPLANGFGVVDKTAFTQPPSPPKPPRAPGAPRRPPHAPA